MMDFEIVPESERPELRTGEPTKLALALEAGQTVFIPGGGVRTISAIRNKASYLSVRGYRVHQRLAVREGVRGIYAWADKR